jgi:hypothetical protein
VEFPAEITEYNPADVPTPFRVRAVQDTRIQGYFLQTHVVPLAGYIQYMSMQLAHVLPSLTDAVDVASCATKGHYCMSVLAR